jgi:hypothetical protein
MGKRAMLDTQAIRQAKSAHHPFSFFQAQALAEENLNQIRADFPAIGKPGVFPVDALQYGPGFALLLSDIGRGTCAATRTAQAFREREAAHSFLLQGQ